MGDEQYGAFVFADGALQLLLCLDVEVVRGLVEHEQVHGRLHDFREAHLGRFAARKSEHLRRDVLIREAAGRKGCAYLELREPRVGLPEFVKRRVLVARLILLLEVADGDELTALHRARDGRNHAEQRL